MSSLSCSLFTLYIALLFILNEFLPTTVSLAYRGFDDMGSLTGLSPRVNAHHPDDYGTFVPHHSLTSEDSHSNRASIGCT